MGPPRPPWPRRSRRTSRPSNRVGLQNLRTLEKPPLPFERHNLNTNQKLEKTFLNYITERSQTKGKKYVDLFLFMELPWRFFYLSSCQQWLLGASLPLSFPPATLLLWTEVTAKVYTWTGYIWIEKDSRFSYVTVCENI